MDKIDKNTKEEIINAFSEGEYSDDDYDFSFDDQELDITKFNNVKQSSSSPLLDAPSNDVKFGDSNFEKELFKALDQLQDNSKLQGNQKNMVKNFKSRVKNIIKHGKDKNKKKLYNTFGAFAVAITNTGNKKLIDGSLPHLVRWQHIIKA